MEEYIPLDLHVDIVVEKLISIHYFRYRKGYRFEGESHHFWEFLYVESGNVEIGADRLAYTLCEGDVIFHRPDEFHSVLACDDNSNAIVVSFICNSPLMADFAGMVMKVNEEEKYLMGQIILEARNAFANNIQSGYTALERRENPVPGAEQSVKITLELLLLKLLRDMKKPEEPVPSNKGEYVHFVSQNPKKEYSHYLMLEIEKYIEDHLDKSLRIDMLCGYFNISRTTLKTLFRRKYNMCVTDFITVKRHECAKQLIRENVLNMGEIAARCGYSSASYFTRCFIAAEGMTPTDYSRSVRIYDRLI